MQELAKLSVPAHVGPAVVASDDERFAVAWQEVLQVGSGAMVRLMYMELDLELKQLCGPVDLATGFDPGALPVQPVDMVTTVDGFVVLGIVPLSRGEANVELVQVRRGCEYVQRVRAQRAVATAMPSLASAKEQGFLLVWPESSRSLGVQVLGPKLCK